MPSPTDNDPDPVISRPLVDKLDVFLNTCQVNMFLGLGSHGGVGDVFGGDLKKLRLFLAGAVAVVRCTWPIDHWSRLCHQGSERWGDVTQV